MRPNRLFRSESLRFAALFALVFLTLTGVLIGTIQWLVAGSERDTLIAANEADIATVINGLRAEGIAEAIEVVEQRLGPPENDAGVRRRFTPEAYMVIQNGDGHVLAGNLPFVACGNRTFRLALSPSPRHHHPRIVLGSCTPLTGTATLFVGRDTAAMYATRERILRAFGWVAAGTCVFAILAGLFLGRRFMARVDAITQTCERVIAGRLNERIAVHGRGDEWDRLARAINEMLDRISALLENLQQVSSDVAHDLRTPLTRLRTRLEAARDRSTGVADYSTAISHAIEETDQLLSMFAALLRISQIEAGTRAQRFAAVDLSALLERAYQLFLPVAEDCRHPLSRRLVPGAIIQGDAELLTQLFSNVIENAFRHTPAGTRVLIALERGDADLIASIADDGPGIAAEDLDKVTRRFYRGASSRSAEGHGLGLSLVSAIAQLHGAKLALSDTAPGLRVSVAFALGEATRPAPRSN